jgi:hypothetical protein
MPINCPETKTQCRDECCERCAIRSREFDEFFGTEKEERAHADQMRRSEAEREAECVAGTRQRCECGAPSLFVDEERGPLCAPCGYHYAN